MELLSSVLSLKLLTRTGMEDETVACAWELIETLSIGTLHCGGTRAYADPGRLFGVSRLYATLKFVNNSLTESVYINGSRTVRRIMEI